MSVVLAPSPALTDVDFGAISALVRDLCGIHLSAGKKALVRSRLARRLRATDTATYAEYIDRLRNDATGEELDTLVDAISTNQTAFLREAAHFAYLRERVLAARRWDRGAGEGLAIWSAGCSSGEEPYTIAMTVAEEWPGAIGRSARVLATDVSRTMLRTARAAEYDKEKLADVPAHWRQRHFRPVRGGPAQRYRVRGAARAMVHFARLNLMEAWPMRGPFDAIFCRNVMIYFEKRTQQELVRRFWKLLAPGGTLFVGHSESLAGVCHGFRYVQPTVYVK